MFDMAKEYCDKQEKVLKDILKSYENRGDRNMAIPGEIIVNKYEATYSVHLIDLKGDHTVIKLKAKKIVKTQEDITFYDYYGCVTGYFRNDNLLGYATTER